MVNSGIGRRALCFVVSIATVVLPTGNASAQPTPECLQALTPLLEDTSNDCIGHPSNLKFFETSTFTFGGFTNLAVNNGNEIQLWRIPNEGDASNFGVDNQGDSDYDLLNYSICDECRYGFAVFKLGMVLFDMGTGGSPNFGSRQFYPSSLEPWGGFTFKIGSQQYLLANFLPNDCGGDATLYELDGVDQSNLNQIGCVDVPGYSGKILSGFHIPKAGVDYIYLGFGNRREFGNTINLQYTGNDQLRAYLARGKGMAVDKNAELAVTTMVNDGTRVYDISDPANPVQRAFRAGNVDLAGMKYPFAWTARSLVPDSTVTYNIENPSNPVVLDQNFWHPDHPWNNHTDHCEWPQSASFSDDGNTMYFARYSVVQMIDFTACAGPIQPTAQVNVPSVGVFPGDFAEVSDGSLGTVERRAIWVTIAENPASGVVCPPGGLPDLSSGNPQSISCLIRQDLEANRVRWAHVAVDNGDFLCGFGSNPLDCPDIQIDSAEIPIDREPDAVITINPSAPITGESVPGK